MSNRGYPVRPLPPPVRPIVAVVCGCGEITHAYVGDEVECADCRNRRRRIRESKP